MTRRIFHRVGDEAWDHPEDRPFKKYTTTTRPCPICTRRTRPHPLDGEAERQRAAGAPAQVFEELRKQGWKEPSSR